MTKPKSQLKSKSILVKVTPAELKELRKMAETYGNGNLSDWLRQAGMWLV